MCHWKAGKGVGQKVYYQKCYKNQNRLAESKIHTLGTFQNKQVAMGAICNFIIGSPPSQVYAQLQQLSKSKIL